MASCGTTDTATTGYLAATLTTCVWETQVRVKVAEMEYSVLANSDVLKIGDVFNV